MIRTTLGRRRGLTLALTAVTAMTLTTSASAHQRPDPRPLPPRTQFYVPKAPPGSQRQIARLTFTGHRKEAALIRREVRTPQAVWFTSGSPREVRHAVKRTVQRAAGKHTVPTLVAYNVPGRDCSQYSSGGAGSDPAYRKWADGFADGLTKHHKVIVVVEPDGLANLPSDCPGAYPGQDIAALTAGRIADIHYIGEAIQKRDSEALVYLDAGHSAWHSVKDITARLEQAEVQDFEGFSLNVSNYQWSANSEQYGTWVSECLALNPGGVPSGDENNCGDQYYNGGPLDGYATGVALDPAKQWSDTATDPSAYTANINARYAQALGSSKPTAHFVVDTSRNGQGPWTPTRTYPDPQTWCNPPGRGLGPRPQGSPDPENPLLDAYQWIKTPGQSDGQCNRGIAGSTTDPEWNGITDPVAGAWFPRQALQLAELADPPLTSARH